MALLWSAIAAGLSVAASLLAKGIFQLNLRGVPGTAFATLAFKFMPIFDESFRPFALPTLAGNICGTTLIFALISHARIRHDMSNNKRPKSKRKEAS